ncbi:uroporphyrinogen-III synthase [Sphingomonas sp.]|uniref:uroporphyrinogen-III synthase n=1 Tax=Sphingomonas sp. TaxID=28214 RepID=UPI001EC04746|nr:uroporphyrinogen-III synthase [Sphingomonas sp.]MBX3593673.1 uroporphyrinogen-III synthase [Sphingomonas sp.]
MTRQIAILRPQPGNDATADRVRAAGLEPLALPLFALTPIAWHAPDPAGFDALLLTSANAVRHGGAQLAHLRALPVLAVGEATAAAARAMGFTVRRTGARDIAALLVQEPRTSRLLWLAARDRTTIDHPAIAATIPVYSSDPVIPTRAQLRRLAGTVALIHSARAGRALAHALDEGGIARAALRIAAISARAAAAAGPGWGAVAIAERPEDGALIAAARGLAIDP